MTWHYQIVEEDLKCNLGSSIKEWKSYSIVEVYLNKQKEIFASTSPETISGFEDPQDLKEALKMMLDDAEKYGVINQKDLEKMCKNNKASWEE